MSDPMKLDEFLSSQSSRSEAFTATVEPIKDNTAEVKITPFQEGRGCGCSSSFTLKKEMIRSVAPTGNFHRCCGKRLEIVEIEFAENASVPVADLMKRAAQSRSEAHAATPHEGIPYGMTGGNFGQQMPGGQMPLREGRATGRRGPGIHGSWPIPWTPCKINCIDACVRFCSDTGYDCCEYETRCAIVCDGLWAY